MLNSGWYQVVQCITYIGEKVKFLIQFLKVSFELDTSINLVSFNFIDTNNQKSENLDQWKQLKKTSQFIKSQTIETFDIGTFKLEN